MEDLPFTTEETEVAGERRIEMLARATNAIIGHWARMTPP